ncbi:hypothetical protein KGQ64_12185 [bacterium]|nr:hypothetical protein [bacterium]
MDSPSPDRDAPRLREHVGPAKLVSTLFAGIGLRDATYRHVSAEPDATHHCLAATLLGAIAYGLCVSRRIELAPALLVVVEALRSMGTLVVESAIVWLLGRRMTGRQLPFGSVLRPLALAGAPGILFAIGAIPEVETAVAIGVPAWLLVAFVVAIRAAFDCSWPQAVGLALGVWLVEHLPGALLTLFGSPATLPAG